jgi:hypothetical protein
MSRPRIEPGLPAWEASTLEKSHLDSLFVGYPEPLLGLRESATSSLHTSSISKHEISPLFLPLSVTFALLDPDLADQNLRDPCGYGTDPLVRGTDPAPDPSRVSPFELSHFFAKLEGTNSDLDKTLLICLDSQETAKNKI